MPLLPDPAELDAVAARIDAHSSLLRVRAQHLGTAAARTTWHGPAARSFAAATLDVCVALRHCADRLDAAATALRHHADAVRDTLADVRAAVHDLAAAGHDTTELLHDAALHPQRVVSDGRRLAAHAGSLVGDVLHVVGI